MRLRCPAGGDVCFDIAPTACVGAVRARAVEAWPTGERKDEVEARGARVGVRGEREWSPPFS